MPKLLIAFASAMLLLASSGIWNANAATITNAGTLAPLTKSYAPAEHVAYWRRQYRRAYRRGYYGYGYGYPYYGYAYPPTQPTRITATPTGHTVITATAGATKEQWPSMTTTMKIPRSKTIWGRPHSNVPALRLGSIELRDLLSRELDEANLVLDEWNFARTRDKQSDTIAPV